MRICLCFIRILLRIRRRNQPVISFTTVMTTGNWQAEKAEKDLLGIYFPALLNTLPEPDLKKADLQFIMKDLEESGCLKEKSTLGYLGCIVKTAADKDWEGIFKIYTQKVAHLDYNFGRMNLDLVWKRFWPLIPEGMKKDVKDYIEQGRDQDGQACCQSLQCFA